MWAVDKSIVGKRFQTVEVLDDYILIPEEKDGKIMRKTKWKVRCDCGNEFYLWRNALFKRKVPYCEKCKPVSRRNTRLYHIYHGIKQRCYNPKCPGFEHYGGRGIKMCEEWLQSYESFKDWSLAYGYIERAGLSIDRIDNDGDYSPDNCQWITIGENSAKSNIGKQQVFSKLEYIYAVSPEGERVDITNISKFSRDHGLNISGVNAAIRGRSDSTYHGWKFYSPIARP